MKTIILEEPRKLARIETDAPGRPTPGEALVRVHRVGICGTDLHAYNGRQPYFNYPRILGHELGVEIREIGANDRGLAHGDRCAVEPYLNCGHCIACRNGRGNCCADLKVLGVHLDGGMRPLITVPVHKLHKSTKLSLDQLALVETLGIGAHAVERANLQQGEYALIIGAGPIGLSVMQFAQLKGAKLIVLDLNELRLNFCRMTIGIDHVVNASDDPMAQIEAITNGNLPTAVFDATGNAQSMMNAFNYVAPGGRLIFVSIVSADIAFSDPLFHRREITLLATRNSHSEDFVRIIKLIEDGVLDTSPWITHRCTLDDLVDQFPEFLKPENGVIKAIVDVEAD